MSASANQNALSKHSAEFNEKRSDLGRDFHDLGRITGELASDAVSRVSDNASQYYDQGIKQAKKIESRIQKNPMQSVLIVAGVGLVLGFLCNRR